MTPREELLAALTAERYDNRWWKTPPPPEPNPDNDLATARRRRELLQETNQQTA